MGGAVPHAVAEHAGFPPGTPCEEVHPGMEHEQWLMQQGV